MQVEELKELLGDKRLTTTFSFRMDILDIAELYEGKEKEIIIKGKTYIIKRVKKRGRPKKKKV